MDLSFLYVYTTFLSLAYISLEMKTERSSFLQVPSLFSGDFNWKLRVLSCVIYCLVSLLFRFKKSVSWVLASSLFKVPLFE